MPAASAIASTVVASKPRSAKSSSATRSSSEREVTGGRPGADVDFDTGCNYYPNLVAHKGSSMANAWFETVAEAQRRAKKRLPAPVYGALMAGQESGVSRDGNLDAFSQLGLAPEVANKPPTRELATSVMGQPISMPVMIDRKSTRLNSNH